MRILIDHLTRMADGFICVAGLDEHGRHIRPVLSPNRIPVTLARPHGGVFDIAAVVDLGMTEPFGAAPEHEDHRFDPNAASFVEIRDEAAFWNTLGLDAELCLKDIFGADLQPRGPGAVVPIGGGKASLGTLNPGYRPKVVIDNLGRLRCKLTDPDLGKLNLSVTDFSLHQVVGGSWRIDQAKVAALAADVGKGRPVLLSVGLTRPWPHDDPAHWLQVNNIHLEAPS